MGSEVLFIGTAKPGQAVEGPRFGAGTLISVRIAEANQGPVKLLFEAEMGRKDNDSPMQLQLVRNATIHQGEPAIDDVIWPEQALGGRLSVVNQGNLPVDFTISLDVFQAFGMVEGAVRIRPKLDMHAVYNATSEAIEVPDAVGQPQTQHPGEWLVHGHNGAKFVVTRREFAQHYERLPLTLSEFMRDQAKNKGRYRMKGAFDAVQVLDGNEGVDGLRPCTRPDCAGEHVPAHWEIADKHGSWLDVRPTNWILWDDEGVLTVLDDRLFTRTYERIEPWFQTSDVAQTLEEMVNRAVARVGGRIRIVSDGSIAGCMVFGEHDDTGIGLVEHLEIAIDAKAQTNKATLRMADGRELVVENPIVLLDPPDGIPLEFAAWPAPVEAAN